MENQPLHQQINDVTNCKPTGFMSIYVTTCDGHLVVDFEIVTISHGAVLPDDVMEGGQGDRFSTVKIENDITL